MVMSKAEFDLLKIDIWISGSVNRELAGGYSAIMQSATNGQVFRKTIGGHGINTTVTRMTLKALLSALQLIKKQSMIHVYTSCGQISSGLNKHMYKWAKQEWNTDKGDKLQHADLWEQIYDLMQTKILAYKVHLEKIPRGHSDESEAVKAIHISSQYCLDAQKNLLEFDKGGVAYQ